MNNSLDKGVTATPHSGLMAVRCALGEPAFEAPDVLLYETDAVVAMQQIPDQIFDLTVTSPPYNIGKEYETRLPLDAYVEWTDRWIKEVFRLTKPTGAFWLNLGYVNLPGKAKAIPLPYLLWEKVPFYLLQEVVWNYGAGVAARRMFSPRNEKFLWYVKSSADYTFNLDAVRDPDVKYPNQKKNGKLRVNQLGKNPTDVWQVPKVTTGEGMTGRRASPERTNHPAQFPMAVIERIVKACSNEGDLIFDPFVGSGTTAEVAIANGRTVVGFEIKAAYVDVAKTRLMRYMKRKQLKQAQQRLFFDG